MAAFSFVGRSICTTFPCASRFSCHISPSVHVHRGCDVRVPHEPSAALPQAPQWRPGVPCSCAGKCASPIHLQDRSAALLAEGSPVEWSRRGRACQLFHWRTPIPLRSAWRRVAIPSPAQQSSHRAVAPPCCPQSSCQRRGHGPLLSPPETVSCSKSKSDHLRANSSETRSPRLIATVTIFLYGSISSRRRSRYCFGVTIIGFRLRRVTPRNSTSEIGLISRGTKRQYMAFAKRRCMNCFEMALCLRCHRNSHSRFTSLHASNHREPA